MKFDSSLSSDPFSLFQVIIHTTITGTSPEPAPTDLAEKQFIHTGKFSSANNFSQMTNSAKHISSQKRNVLKRRCPEINARKAWNVKKTSLLASDVAGSGGPLTAWTCQCPLMIEGPRRSSARVDGDQRLSKQSFVTHASTHFVHLFPPLCASLISGPTSA